MVGAAVCCWCWSILASRSSRSAGVNYNWKGAGGGVVARLEVGQSLPDLVEVGEVVEGHDLALHH
jgi:hypothetical protein